MSLFKVVRKNLIHARAVIRQYGKCYLHGDGNIYINLEDSGFRKDFTNPNADGTPPAAAYVLCFTSIDQVPTTVQACEEAFLKAKNQEQRDNANKAKSIPLVKTFEINESDSEGIELDEDEEEFKPANQSQLAPIPKAESVKTPPPPPPPPPVAKTSPAPAGKGQTAAAVGNKGGNGKGKTPPPPPPPPIVKDQPVNEGFTVLKPEVEKSSEGVNI